LIRVRQRHPRPRRRGFRRPARAARLRWSRTSSVTSEERRHTSRGVALFLTTRTTVRRRCAHLRQNCGATSLRASNARCATSSGEETKAAPDADGSGASTSHASATARSCEGKSNRKQPRLGLQSAVNGAPPADCARRWRGSCRFLVAAPNSSRRWRKRAAYRGGEGDARRLPGNPGGIRFQQVARSKQEKMMRLAHLNDAGRPSAWPT